MHYDAPVMLVLSAGTLIVGLLAAAVAGRRLSNTQYSFILALASVALGAVAVTSWGGNDYCQAPYPISFAGAACLFRFDALTSLFMALLSVLGLAVAVYSPGYLEHLQESLGTRRYWCSMFLFVSGIAGVLLSANGITFIVFWELMALSSTVLVASDLGQSRSQLAAVVYLGATRLSTAFLMVGFFGMYASSHSWNFSQWHSQGGMAAWPLVLIFLGLCIKGGIWPMHIWLPYAHTAAPAPVSALMSGVMIKVAVYAVVRLLILFDISSFSLSYLALVLGAVSAFWGILFALEQTDMKRLLAYSSVENVGLMFMGLGVAMYGKAANLPDVAALGLTAALVHCLNHGLFKALLFLSVGVIDSRVHVRDLNKLGGLAQVMPWTTSFFLLGCFAACALPPLNGFIGKWYLYQALLSSANQSMTLWQRAAALLAIGTLGMVGGLALASFTKSMGIAFLGRARSQAVMRAKEGSSAMLIAQAMLALACLGLGSAGPLFAMVMKPLGRLAGWTTSDGTTNFAVPTLVVLCGLTLLVVLIYGVALSRRVTAQRRYRTWDCGFGDLSTRTEATADSFAQPIARIFSPVLHYQVAAEIEGKDRRHFPERITVEPRMSSILEERIYRPSIRLIERLSTLVARIQAGSIHLYLLYMCVTLVLLLVIGLRI